MEIFSSQNIYALPNYNLYSLPLNIEYEKLDRTLQDNINKRYVNIIDRRTTNVVPTLTPGVSNKINNQSSINFEEPNTKPAYPQASIPYSQGLVWE